MRIASALVMVGAIITLFLGAGSVSAQTQPVIGLITKTKTNPFFVKMREGAQAAANSNGARLLTGAGKADGDNAGQVTAMENMIAAGARAILITPNDSKAIVPSIKKTRDKASSSSRSTAPRPQRTRLMRSSPRTTTRRVFSSASTPRWRWGAEH